MEDTKAKEEVKVKEFVFTNPKVQGMTPEEREELATKLKESDSYSTEEQEALLKLISNDNCSKGSCYGRGYKGWRTVKIEIPVTDENEEEVLEKTNQMRVDENDQTFCIIEKRVPVACDGRGCAEHTRAEILRDKFLRDYREKKAKKEAKKKVKEEKESQETPETTEPKSE